MKTPAGRFLLNIEKLMSRFLAEIAVKMADFETYNFQTLVVRVHNTVNSFISKNVHDIVNRFVEPNLSAQQIRPKYG